MESTWNVHVSIGELRTVAIEEPLEGRELSQMEGRNNFQNSRYVPCCPHS